MLGLKTHRQATWTRRLVRLAVALCCAALVVPAATARPPRPRRSPPPRRPAATRPASQPASLPATQPAGPPVLPRPTTPDAEEPYAVARQRLARIRPADRTPNDHALLVALEFVLALGRSDGARAAGLVDAPGYVVLPLVGDLPEKPDKPLTPALVGERISARSLAPAAGAAARSADAHGPLDDVPMQTVRVLTRDALCDEFPAVALWMLPQDRAVVFRAPEDGPARDWLTCPACVVVRIRADRATIIGGNLLETLAPR